MGDETPSGPAERAARDAADQAALARIQAGDAAAVAVLYDHHGATALALATRIVRSRDEADDVVHDAFVAIVERARQYRPERGSVAGWLLTTVRNLALDRARRRARREGITRDELAHEPRAPSHDPEQRLDRASEAARVRQALLALPPAQRATLELAFDEGLSYPEIAARQGVALGTVKSRAARALWALRGALGVDEPTIRRQTGAAPDP
jgi:RNA polymerase sigma-70 factor (ECF subfamily)